MSRRTHGLVALLATAALVALVLAWWAPAHGPGDPVTAPSVSPTAPTSSALAVGGPVGEPVGQNSVPAHRPAAGRGARRDDHARAAARARRCR